MPFAARRCSDGAFMTRCRTWEEDPGKVRLFTRVSDAANALRQLYPPKEGESVEVEVVEIEWRIVSTKQSYVLTRPSSSYSHCDVEKIERTPQRFRHAD